VVTAVVVGLAPVTIVLEVEVVQGHAVPLRVDHFDAERVLERGVQL
jgi:hypothetical protein